MVSTPSRYRVRFAVHISPTYRDNYLAELAENTHAETRELADGTIEIAAFLPKERSEVLHALKQEERRGALLIEGCI